MHQSIVRTVGGIIGPAETLMLVVPQQDRLSVDVRIGAIDIDKVFLGQQVSLRFPNFDVRTTPELSAEIGAIAPDLTTDPATGVQYNVAPVEVSASELSKLPAATRLVPGMPVEAFIQTGNRTVLAYLVRPLVDQLGKVFLED